MRNEIVGTVLEIRAIEDTIRATRKYTKGVFSRKRKEYPIQGDDFPSKVVTEYYEVYPETDLEQLRSLWEAVMVTSDWLWGKEPMVQVKFNYNYSRNRGMMTVFGGNGVMKMLGAGIPGFDEAVALIPEPSTP